MQLTERTNSASKIIDSYPKAALDRVPIQEKNLSKQLILDDEDLIDTFVKGEGQTLSSHNLQMTSPSETLALKTHKNELVAVIKSSYKIKSSFIKLQSVYSKELHRRLVKENFVPFGVAGEQKDFFEYHQYWVPPGYEMFYTEAGLLWKLCWPKRRSPIYKLQLDTLIFTKGSYENSWSPLRDIAIYKGKIYLKTLVNQIALDPTDKVAWINKITSLNGEAKKA